MPFSSANLATGEDCNFRPLPAGASGEVTISEGIYPLDFKISKVSLATSGVPKNMKFILIGFRL